MSIDNEKVEDALVEDIASEELTQEEELVENENLDEESLEEKAAAKSESEDEDVKEEEEEEEEEVKEAAPELSVPKTKAGVIQAAVEMLKKARKEDAQKLYAKMAKVDEAEDDGSVGKAIAAVKGKTKDEPKVKAKVESIDFDEDLDALVLEEATLSEGFRGKAGAIFEAVLTSKLTEEVDRL